MNYSQQWREQGYLIVRQAFPAARIKALFDVCESVHAQWRRESTAEGEPYGFCYGPKAWVLLHLNHPKYHRQHPARLADLLNAVADPLALQILGECFREEAVMMQANYYVNPTGEGWTGAWHRDCQFYPGVDEAKQRVAVAAEADPPRELHMHIPLMTTAATEVVPGSHRRWDTAAEHQVRTKDPVEGQMPGALRIALEPGDLAFFHVNAIHRGIYTLGVPRRTIAVTYSRAADPRPATAESMKAWRGYVATYQPWFQQPGYLDGCTPAARKFFQRFTDIYQASWKPEYLAELNPQMQEYFTKY